MGNVFKKVMCKAWFDGHFTNHSLRRSCATNLYHNGVPEQVIQETTGHRSVEGVRAYKRTSSAKRRKVSAILNQSESSLSNDHKRRNTKKECDHEDAEDQIEQHNISDKKEVSVCDIGFDALDAERHDKVETKGESCKNIVITAAETKIEICYTLRKLKCMLRIFFVFKYLLWCSWLFLGSKKNMRLVDICMYGMLQY